MKEKILVKRFMKAISEKHRNRILDFLAGEKVGQNALWLSVGYFTHGAGASEDQSFASEEQWLMLREETNHVFP